MRSDTRRCFGPHFAPKTEATSFRQEGQSSQKAAKLCVGAQILSKRSMCMGRIFNPRRSTCGTLDGTQLGIKSSKKANQATFPREYQSAGHKGSLADARSLMSQEKVVRSWGYSHVFTWTDGRNAYYPPHRHATETTHLILKGSLTIRYPEGIDPDVKTTHGVGERVDVGENVLHEVWIGDEGCTYVIGE